MLHSACRTALDRPDFPGRSGPFAPYTHRSLVELFRDVRIIREQGTDFVIASCKVE